MTDEEREILKRELEGLAEAEAKIFEARRPLDIAMNAIAEVRFNLLERHGIEHEDYDLCETCDMPIFTGEPIFSYDDGPAFCGEHAPTRAECRENLEECVATGNYDPDEVVELQATIAHHKEHVVNGGSWDDRVTWTR